MYMPEKLGSNPVDDSEIPNPFDRLVASDPEIMVYEGSLEKDGIYLLIDPADEAAQQDVETFGIESVDSLPGGSLSAADSVHKVEMKVFLVRCAGAIFPMKVALKPFDADDPDNPTESPETELHATMKAKGRGFDVMEPFAMAKYGNVRFLATKYRNNLWTLDNVNYTIHPDSPAYEHSMIKPALGLMTNTLAELHAKGIAHGDPQAKNFMVDDTGEVPIPDLEMAVIAESTEEHIQMLVGEDDDIARSPFFKDVLLCWHTLTSERGSYNNIFLKDVELDVYNRVFEEFVDMYLYALDAHLDPELAVHFKPEEFKEDMLSHYLLMRIT